MINNTFDHLECTKISFWSEKYWNFVKTELKKKSNLDEKCKTKLIDTL
jgi:hypothetical protein